MKHIPVKYRNYKPDAVVRFVKESVHFPFHVGETYTITHGPKAMCGTYVFWADGLSGCWACSHFEFVK